MSGALPLAEEAAGPRCPCFPGAGGVGVGIQHQPHMVRSCEPALRAEGVAGGRPRGGVPRAVVRGVWGQPRVLPRLPVLGAGSRGPLPQCCGGGCAGVKPRHCFFGVRALRGARRRLGGRRSSSPL